MDAKFYSLQRRLLWNLFAAVVMSASYVFATMIFPARAFDAIGAGWLVVPAVLVVVIPGVLIGSLLGGRYMRAMKREFLQRIEATA